MTLVFGMKLAAAGPILLTFDWTGQCDDCQGPNGAIDVPGTNWYDGYTQDVTGLLKVNYDPDIDPDFGPQFEFVSFVYNGSSIVHTVEAFGVLYNDFYSAFTIEDNIVEFTGNMQLEASEFGYKGAYADLNIGDVYFEKEGDRYVVFGINHWMEFSGSMNTFQIRVDYDYVRYVAPGDDGSNGRGGGSRDEGYGSIFVMRGTLPSHLASPIPEPSTIAIFALGMVGLSLRRQKRS
jgi:hypothetical protein